VKTYLIAFLFFIFLPLGVESKEGWREEPFYGKGRKYTLEQFKDKDVILVFYATWCRYCEKELPQIANLKRLIKDPRLAIIPVSVDFEPDQSLKHFLRKNMAENLPLYVDMSGKFARRLGVNTIPSIFLIKKDSAIISEPYYSLGDIDSDFFAKYLKNEKE